MAFLLYSNESLTVIEVQANRFDARMIPHFRQYLNQLEQTITTKLLIDLTNVVFMDSSALGTLMALHKTHYFSELAIVSDNPPVLQLIKITKVDQLVRVYPNIDQALIKMNS
ncbi:STAS domain-containing protein [Vibrio sp. E150_011]|uniref:STAS domain-containing protein n=1 Tax=Vibrio sp. 10N.261.51.F12 TaxID=3229679 RepID=UPI0035526766